MTKATTRFFFFLVIFHNHQQFFFFSRNISLDASSLISLICLPLVSSRSQSVPRRTAPRGPIPAVSFGLGGKGVEVVEENVFFFFLT